MFVLSLTTKETLDVIKFLSSKNEETRVGDVVFSKSMMAADIEFDLQVVAGDDDFWAQVVMFENGFEISCSEPIFNLDEDNIELSDKFSVCVEMFSDRKYDRIDAINVGNDYRYSALCNIVEQENSFCSMIKAAECDCCDLECECECEHEQAYEMSEVDSNESGFGIGKSFIFITDENNDAVLSFVLTGYANESVWTCCYKSSK